MASSNNTSHRSNGSGQNLDSPINKIPDELLALVFVHIDDRTSLPNHKPIPHILSSVDRHWRRVAINLSSLWSHIILSFEKFRLSPSTYVERQSLWIERSRTSPLDISIDLGNMSAASCVSEKPLLNLVLPNIDRWRYFNVVTDRAKDIKNFATALDSAAAPLLREAVIIIRCTIMEWMTDMDGEDGEIHPGQKAFLRGGSPSLRSVRLIGVDNFSTFPLHNLTFLDLRNQIGFSLRPTFEDLCNLIAASPGLKYLTLHSLYFRIVGYPDLAPIILKSLKSLSINFRPIPPYVSTHGLFIFLYHLSAPALEEMELICMQPLQINMFPELISRRSPRFEYTNLHTFKLAISTSRDNRDIEELFNLFCSSTTTFFSIRNHGFSVIPAKTEVLIADPGDSGLELETAVESPLRLVRVPRHAGAITSSEFTIEVVDSPALFKYTGEDDSDLFATERAEEEEEQDDVDFDDYDYEIAASDGSDADADDYVWY